MSKSRTLIGCILLSGCAHSIIEFEPKFNAPVNQEAKGLICYTDIVLTDNRSRTLTYGKNLRREAALEWFQSAIQTLTNNRVNFVAAPSSDHSTLEIALDFAYVSHAYTNKVGVVAFTASKAGQQAHFRGNSSNANWASTKSEFAAALNRAVSKALHKLVDSDAFCDARPAVWRKHDQRPSSKRPSSTSNEQRTTNNEQIRS